MSEIGGEPTAGERRDGTLMLKARIYARCRWIIVILQDLDEDYVAGFVLVINQGDL
jgi:hypothetical protein